MVMIVASLFSVFARVHAKARGISSIKQIGTTFATSVQGNPETTSTPLGAEMFPQMSLPKGKIAFQSQTDNKGDAKLWVYDFQTAKPPLCLNTRWKSLPIYPYNTLNPNFSKDGKTLVFTGYTGVSPKDRKDVWSCSIDGTNLKNLTGNLQGNSEDPKFSPNGTRIVFKYTFNDNQGRKRQIWEMKANGTNPVLMIRDTSRELSMPCYSQEGTLIYYASCKNDTQGDAIPGTSDIYAFNLNTMTSTPVANVLNIQEYYPISAPSNRLLYARWRDTKNAHDQIYIAANGTQIRLPAPLNKEDSESADPYPINERYILFSSTRNKKSTNSLWAIPTRGRS